MVDEYVEENPLRIRSTRNGKFVSPKERPPKEEPVTTQKWYQNLPNKQDTTPLTSQKVKEVVGPLHKEPEVGN